MGRGGQAGDKISLEVHFTMFGLCQAKALLQQLCRQVGLMGFF
jgi:hypothetical protein